MGLLTLAWTNQDPSIDIGAVRRWSRIFSSDGMIPDDGFEAAKRIVAILAEEIRTAKIGTFCRTAFALLNKIVGVLIEKVRTANINAREVYTNEFVREAR